MTKEEKEYKEALELNRKLTNYTTTISIILISLVIINLILLCYNFFK